MPNSAPPKGFTSPVTDSVAGTTKELNLRLRVIYEKAIDQNVLVRFTLDNALVDAYNIQWGTSYKLASLHLLRSLLRWK